jgi:GNAT superfamily N-acetyltransferase
VTLSAQALAVRFLEYLLGKLLAQLIRGGSVLTVRPAQAADVDAVVSVGQLAWPATYTPLAGADYVERGLATWWSRDGILRSIEAGNVTVAELDGEIVGMTGIEPGAEARFLWKLYVRPADQGHGAGTALLNDVLRRARDDGAGTVRLEYLDGNDRAARFYQGKGFVPLGREPDPDGGPDSIWMEIRL